MNNRVRLGILLISCFILLSVAQSSSFSWFTDNQSEKLLVKAAIIDVGIDEEFTPPENFVPTPSAEITKKVKFTNNSTNPIYLRVRLDPMWCNADGSFYKYAGNDIVLNLHDKNGTGQEWKNNWALVKGYYYYRTSVGVSSSTSTLLDSFTFKDDFVFTDDLNGKIFRLKVTAEAIQTTNNAQSAWGY